MRRFYTNVFTLLVTAFVGIGLCWAQESVPDAGDNPLVARTGPNTVGAGHLWLSVLGQRYGYKEDCGAPSQPVLVDFDAKDVISPLIRDSIDWISSSQWGVGMALRYGIGSRFEVMLSTGATSMEHRSKGVFRFTDSRPDQSFYYRDTVQTVGFTLGCKWVVLKGDGKWVPRMAVYGVVPFLWNRYGVGCAFEFADGLSQSMAMGIRLRNTLNHRWVLDYGLGYRYESGRIIRKFRAQREWKWNYTVMARWLATDRLLLGLGVENLCCRAEVLWQALPSLQVKAGGVVGASYDETYAGTLVEGSLMVGVDWMIK